MEYNPKVINRLKAMYFILSAKSGSQNKHFIFQYFQIVSSKVIVVIFFETPCKRLAI
jgi:hypothetical protein